MCNQKTKSLDRFEDPKGIFSIGIQEEWKFNNDPKAIDRGLFQFEVSEDCVFQISCKEIDDHISGIIEANSIKAHDFNLPNISFQESYKETGTTNSYIWMASVGNHFFMAIYFYDTDTKPWKEVGIDLMDARLCIRNLIYKKKPASKIDPKEVDTQKDYSDIINWRNGPTRFLDFFSDSNKSKAEMVSPIEIDVVKLYALLKTKISNQPNGFHNLVRVGMPMDAMIWWDFVLESDQGFIQIWRTPFLVEAIYEFEGTFDLKSFLEENIIKYSDEINNTISSFEKHTVYINHYKSYDQCVKTLWEEISKLNLDYPESPSQHLTESSEVDEYTRKFKSFASESVKYHALAKSLVLNAAFKVESFLNLVVRVGGIPELKLYPEVLKKFLRLDFSHRIKNLRFYSQILTNDFDMGSQLYQDIKDLMTLRNKYVHFDEDQHHNRLGEIFFDDNYPLHPTESNRPAIEAIKQTFHKPEIEVVRKANEIADKFVEELESLFIPEIKEKLRHLMNQNTIGYNEKSGIYSSVYSPVSVDFFTFGDSKEQD